MDMEIEVPAGTYRIRTMTRKDVEMAVAWAAAEGWNPGLNDADCFYASAPDGFFVGELDGEAVATASLVIYDDSFAFGGFYMVKPGHRGKGLGLTLFQTVASIVGNRNVGADGVVEQQENYRKSGMVFAHRNIRYGGSGGEAMPKGVEGLAGIAFEDILQYDTEHFPTSRERFLRHWITSPNAQGFAVRDAGKIAGYGVVRQCLSGSKIGPLFADDTAKADLLFCALSSVAGAGPLFLDVPEPNGEGVELARRHGMSPVFETGRMYTQEPPDLPLGEIFGITSFELG
jgi:GNAT superfamily N-acetyltransferase